MIRQLEETVAETGFPTNNNGPAPHDKGFYFVCHFARTVATKITIPEKTTKGPVGKFR